MAVPSNTPVLRTYFPLGRFRIHPDPTHAALKVQLSRAGEEWWLVQPDLLYICGVPELRCADLYEGQMGDGSSFVLVLPHPGEVESELYGPIKEAVAIARTQWVAVQWGAKGTGVVVIAEPANWLEFREWPKRDFLDTVVMAFQGRLIFTQLDMQTRLSVEPSMYGKKAYSNYQQQVKSLLA